MVSRILTRHLRNVLIVQSHKINQFMFISIQSIHCWSIMFIFGLLTLAMLGEPKIEGTKFEIKRGMIFQD